MGKEIFILEDDKDIGFILNHILFEEGYRVQVYETLSAIRNALHMGFPDLLLMDVRLPDGNGMDLCAEIKEQKIAEVPVIMMSAHWDINREGGCAADEYISKPFDLDHLVTTIGAYLSN